MQAHRAETTLSEDGANDNLTRCSRESCVGEAEECGERHEEELSPRCLLTPKVESLKPDGDSLHVHSAGDVRKSPNDPKLSDCGARRGSCVVERRRSIQTTAKGGAEKTGPSQK